MWERHRCRLPGWTAGRRRALDSKCRSWHLWCQEKRETHLGRIQRQGECLVYHPQSPHCQCYICSSQTLTIELRSILMVCHHTVQCLPVTLCWCLSIPTGMSWYCYKNRPGIRSVELTFVSEEFRTFTTVYSDSLENPRVVP